MFLKMVPFVILSALISIKFAQQCLQSPPELEFIEEGDENGVPVYHATLNYDAKTFTTDEYGYPISFTTRVHNDMLPSPTIRMKQDAIYKITLINNLGPNDPTDPGIMNEFHHPNTTNIHTHGLHVSPESPSDDVFISIHPGETFEHSYYIPCNHHGGTNWYHPHHHGSSNVQVGAGTAGALIIEDDVEREGLPAWLSEIDEIVLVIQGLDLNRWMTRTAGRFVSGDENRDFLTHADLTGDSEKDYFYLINDQYQPSICLKKGQWTRFRMVHNDVRFDTELLFGDTEACQVQLLAKDGVYLSQSPRELSTNLVYFTQSSRVDILIKCDTVGTYEILSWDHVENQENLNWIIGYLEVTDDESPGNDIIDVSSMDANVIDNSKEIEITPFEPIRPRYLEDLLGFDTSEVDHFWRVQFGGGDNINGVRFQGPESFPDEYQPTIDTLNEWDVVNIFNAKHPLHVHVNHFQIVDGHHQIGNDPVFTLPGDWVDTVAYDSKIRFVTDTFGGKVVLHCHILEHEDRGKMAVYYVSGGCDATDINCIRAEAECSEDNIDIFKAAKQYQQFNGTSNDESQSQDEDTMGIGDYISEWLFEKGYYSILIWSGIVIVVLLFVIFAYWIRCRSIQNEDDKNDKLMDRYPMRKDGSGSYGSVHSESEEQHISL